jgi:hypothetical protein
MNKTEAREILSSELARFAAGSYADLAKLVGSIYTVERTGADGTRYQIEIEVLYDDPRDTGGDLRVIGSIDDGTLKAALRPLSEDLIVAPDGEIHESRRSADDTVMGEHL